MLDHAPLLERIFSLDLKEQSYRIESIDGHIPDYVQGNYYLNGPAQFTNGDFRYRNWLDGDGMVCALRFENGQIYFTNRFVRTTKRVAEEEAGKPLYRMFGTAFEGDRLKRGIGTESPANVSIYKFGDRLLAFGEQSIPFELHPTTLETLDIFTFNGRLNKLSPFSAHPKIDFETGDLFNFGISFSATNPSLTVYRFNGDGDMVYRKRTSIDYACTTHDFGISQTYCIFYLCPYILDIGVLMAEGGATIDALKWSPERGSQMRLFSRETGEEQAAIPMGNRYCLHLSNCFEENGLVTVDVIEHDRTLYDQYQVIPDLFTTASRGGPVRYLIDPKKNMIVDRHEIEYYVAPDFPAFDPRRFTKSYDDMWMLGISAAGEEGRKFLDQLVHLEWKDKTVRDVYQAPPKHYLGGEPVFIGNPNDENEGLIICQQFDAETRHGTFLLFDAFRVAQGPVATLHLQNPIHLGFHAFFEQTCD
ncbi:MAG: carotenoid oxygenase family protein [Candidatus Latescibacteria bacterium]|jgi:all-trans-8'-apo-beta-carotenal 15,15'-oxygenase|nr:carotenoid oxygenase family protein [Candidatus Latescibacterota bacterium]